MSNEPQQEAQVDPQQRSLADIKLLAEIGSLEASSRKATADALNAEAQYKELIRRRAFLERILSATQATIVLALFTLMSQIIQFGYTARQSRVADENKQWRDTVGGVSFWGDSKSIGGALNLEAFLESPGHGEEAKTLLAPVLPYIKDKNAFDHFFYNLLHHDGWAYSGPHVYTVAKAVGEA